MKEGILRGVLEDNLKILGRHKTPVQKKRGSRRRRYIIISAFVLIAVLLQFDGISPNRILNGPFTAGASAKNFYSPSLERSAAPSDYRELISNPKLTLKKTFGLGVRTIMLDPGHGGEDSGTLGRMGTKEKDMTLDIALRLRELLIKDGRFNIVMTRSSDVAVPLNKRVDMALADKADLFLSIHLNYLPSKPINMIETYYFGPSSDAVTTKLAERENAGSRYGLSDFRELIARLGDTMKLQESMALAGSIQKNLYQNIRRETGTVYDYGVKRAPFVVLLGVNVPSVLAEVSCLSNRDEEKKMNSEAHRENIAHYLEAGILDYINKGEADHDAGRRE